MLQKYLKSSAQKRSNKQFKYLSEDDVKNIDTDQSQQRFGISYSNISTFLSCPRKWKLTYIDGLEAPSDSIDTIYGTAMHETIQAFLTEYYAITSKLIIEDRENYIQKYSTFLMERLLLLYKQRLEGNYDSDVSPQQLKQYLGFGIDLLKEFIPKVSKWFPKKNTQLYGIELRLEQPNDWCDLPFTGYLDIVLYDKMQDRYKIIDLKTSRMGWKHEKKDQIKRLQLLLYKYFFARFKQIDPDKVDIQFIILKKMIFENGYNISRIQKFVPPQANVTLKKALKLVQQTIEDMKKIAESGEDGEMKPSNYCNYCPFKQNKELCTRKRTLPKK